MSDFPLPEPKISPWALFRKIKTSPMARLRNKCMHLVMVVDSCRFVQDVLIGISSTQGFRRAKGQI